MKDDYKSHSKTLQAALESVIYTMALSPGHHTPGKGPSLHTFLAAGSVAVGGFGDIPVPAVELPVQKTVTFHPIAGTT